MSIRIVSRFTALMAAGAVVVTAACHSNSTSPSKNVNLTGTFGLASYTENGNSITIDPTDSAVLSFTTTNYTVLGTGNFVALTDTGSYRALDSATVNGDLVGQYTTVTSVSGNQDIAGSFSFSSDLDTLIVTYNLNNGIGTFAIVSTYVRLAT